VEQGGLGEFAGGGEALCIDSIRKSDDHPTPIRCLAAQGVLGVFGSEYPARISGSDKFDSDHFRPSQAM